jgi:hypothetical protein
MMAAASFFVAVIAGAIAAMSGFGIGSLLTPLLVIQCGTKLAVSIVSVPHLVRHGIPFRRSAQHVFLGSGIGP